MNDAEQDELTPELQDLVRALRMVGSIIDRLKDSHGGFLQSFLRHSLADYPDVKTALDAIAPATETKRRFDAMYAAIDYIAKHDLL